MGLGPKTQEFEKEVGKLIGAKNVIAVNSGTSALHIALEGAKFTHNIEPGDEVIVPALTFASSVQSILMAGLKPVFCDIQEKNINVDPADIAKRITPKTKIIMPVHYAGEACDMDDIMALAHENSLLVIEDAAHAFGSTYRGKPIGTIGDITCFSFDPIKNITCIEGGAVATEDDKLAETLRTMRIVGISKDTWSRYQGTRLWTYDVITPGFRYHMSDVNAAVGLTQLKRFYEYRDKKRWIVARYDAALENIPGLKTLGHNLEEIFPFMYVVKVEGGKRDPLMRFLKEEAIETGIHYVPNHFHEFFGQTSLSLPVTEKIYHEILTLPLFYEMTDTQLERVIETIKKFFC